MSLSSAEIMELLDLHPHPTCGFTNEIYRSAMQVPKADLPAGYDGPRTLGGFLYFLVTEQAHIRLATAFARTRCTITTLATRWMCCFSTRTARARCWLWGADLAAGMRPQLLVPGGTFHAGRIRAGGDYALLGTSVWLRAEPSDVEMGNVEVLMTKYPAAKAEIGSFTA